MKFLYLTVFLLLALPHVAMGQAYCSLRDPVNAIQSSLPDFDHYRSIVRRIQAKDRDAILEALPFTIHDNELGTHTLYTAFDENEVLVGIVHVRTERGRWGLTEIAWTFDPELRIVEMHFQRSRDRSRAYIESEAFQQALVGKGFSELKSMLDEKGTSINPALLDIPADAHDTVVSVIQSALKTILTTETVWDSSLVRLRKNSDPT
jgi:hypothetical protein